MPFTDSDAALAHAVLESLRAGKRCKRAALEGQVGIVDAASAGALDSIFHKARDGVEGAPKGLGSLGGEALASMMDFTETSRRYSARVISQEERGGHPNSGHPTVFIKVKPPKFKKPPAPYL